MPAAARALMSDWCDDPESSVNKSLLEGGQIEGAHEESGHLRPGHRQGGAEPIVERRVATDGDSFGCGPFDVGDEGVAVVVAKAAG